ncbi:SAM-dependent methyltransferase [Georgenia sp. Z1344]|uniref:SAM-dependent methyltransferase n=1 Tax=Georgenia sp. Z1344 TaxID=3416706 RepID=UPI003CF4625A
MSGPTTDETDPLPPSGTGARLEINSPLSSDTVRRLARAATAHDPTTIVDHGCGWGAMLLACLEEAPRARGLGLDVHGPDIVRAGSDAERRGLADRVELREADATGCTDRADLLISLGAYQAFGSVPEALVALRERRAGGGRLLFGCETWAGTPTADELAHMWDGASTDDCRTLVEVVEDAYAAGWVLLGMHETTRQEFDDFDLGHLRERQEWLARHPDHADADEIAREVTDWLRGHRRPLGFVTLLLG